MLQNILNLKGINSIKKNVQKQINGGLPPECGAGPSTGCFSGPFYCNIHGLPICNPLDHEA
ncbi:MULTISPECIES: hypothetical protein [Aquimarina]|uniref:Uncharacterized protein n=1 Tax=Aquimarina algiphila TaxID=2047982 RepID=A0A554VHA7_9FLAO|nr:MULTISPECIES: hypothetical protein [Aquimarina]TSE06815.1 hypothetical protein FOF46_18025 [Aquimarina algiphila]